MYAWGILCPGQEEYYPKTMGASIIRNERRFRQLHRGGRKSFRTFMVLNLPRNTRHKGIKILWRLETCNRDLRAEHDGIYAAKIRKISATSNVPITRFRFDELVKNNLLSQSVE